MKTYHVTVLFGASARCTVKAENPEQAEIIAEDLLDGAKNICHQCAEKISTGDAYASIVCEENGDEVLDTRIDTETIRSLSIQRDELLAALKEIADWVDRYTQPNHPVSKFARAAIAKAEEN